MKKRTTEEFKERFWVEISQDELDNWTMVRPWDERWTKNSEQLKRWAIENPEEYMDRDWSYWLNEEQILYYWWENWMDLSKEEINKALTKRWFKQIS